jgi:hypothetical protein
MGSRGKRPSAWELGATEIGHFLCGPKSLKQLQKEIWLGAKNQKHKKNKLFGNHKPLASALQC